MSEPVSAYIDYDVPFYPENIARVLESVCSAVAENWIAHADNHSDNLPDVDELKMPAAVQLILADIESDKREWSSGSRSSDPHYFCFSPVSNWLAYVSIWKYGDGRIGVGLVVAQPVTYEVQGNRQLNRIEHEWEEEQKRRGNSLGSVFEGPTYDDMDEEACDAWWDNHRELSDTPSVWPQNRQCFLNIVEHLKRALPVKSVELDPRLVDGPTKTVTGQGGQSAN